MVGAQTVLLIGAGFDPAAQGNVSARKPRAWSEVNEAVVGYQALVDGVARRAELSSAEHAREVCAAVISTLAHEVPEQRRSDVAELLPGQLREAARVPGPISRDVRARAVPQVAGRLGVSAEQGRYLTQAVLTEIREQDQRLLDRLSEWMPSDLMDSLSDAGLSPDHAASVTEQVPTRTTRADVAEALQRLENWSGDERGIARTVELPGDRLDPLIKKVQRAASAFNDHARVRRDAGSVTFELRTESSGVVTEPDLRLAERIDQVVADFGSGG